MSVVVVPYSPEWPRLFAQVARPLRRVLEHLDLVEVEHVGSTSVDGLAAKPIIDVDVIVERRDVPAAVAALETLGYRHRGDLGVRGREAFVAPDPDPPRHVYVCERGTLNVRNHLEVRRILRERDDLRAAYAEVKLALAAEPGMDIETYVAGKSAVLQKVLTAADFTEEERATIGRLNDPPRR